MSIRSVLAGAGAAMLLAGLAGVAYGQREIAHIPPAIDADGYEPDLVQPLIDPGAFGSDFQFFAPAEADNFGGHREPNEGWFLTYSRMYWQVTRPRGATQAALDSDDMYGNRWDLGYMTDEDHGWLFEQIHVQGSGGNGVNRINLNSVEVSKTFRLEQLHYGSVFEPIFGVRFTSFQDRTFAITNNFTIENRMVGPQIGARWFKEKGRWNLSAEARVFGMANFQTHDNTGGPANSATSFPVGPYASNFVVGGDARIEAAFSVTRDISLVAGWELLYFGTGIARPITNGPPPTSAIGQSATLTGVTFGMQFNR